jgi:hypothetical protein
VAVAGASAPAIVSFIDESGRPVVGAWLEPGAWLTTLAASGEPGLTAIGQAASGITARS